APTGPTPGPPRPATATSVGPTARPSPCRVALPMGCALPPPRPPAPDVTSPRPPWTPSSPRSRAGPTSAGPGRRTRHRPGASRGPASRTAPAGPGTTCRRSDTAAPRRCGAALRRDAGAASCLRAASRTPAAGTPIHRDLTTPPQDRRHLPRGRGRAVLPHPPAPVRSREIATPDASTAGRTPAHALFDTCYAAALDHERTGRI